jgi:hypothetical protein
VIRFSTTALNISSSGTLGEDTNKASAALKSFDIVDLCHKPQRDGIAMGGRQDENDTFTVPQASARKASYSLAHQRLVRIRINDMPVGMRTVNMAAALAFIE